MNLFLQIFSFLTFIVSFIISLVIKVGSIIFLIYGIKAFIKYLNGKNGSEEDKVIKKSLGEVIKNHRIRCNMTQEFVAQYMNVSRQTISKWETGINEPSTTNLLKLAKLFDITPEELLREIQI